MLIVRVFREPKDPFRRMREIWAVIVGQKNIEYVILNIISNSRRMREIWEYLWVKSIGTSSKLKDANHVDSCQVHALFSSHLITSHQRSVCGSKALEYWTRKHPTKTIVVKSIEILNSKASNNNNSCQIHALFPSKWFLIEDLRNKWKGGQKGHASC